jgi:hypothetical protein
MARFVIVAVLAFSVGSASLALGLVVNGVVFACYHNVTGVLRLELADKPCNTAANSPLLRETRIAWNQVGQQGLQGIPGSQGEKGDKGDQGIQGVQGAQGDKGDTGATGPQGLKGDKGDQGVQGVQGEKGDTGATGPQGLKGDKGDTGSQGPTGPQGPQGPAGPTGPSGGSSGTFDLDGLICGSLLVKGRTAVSYSSTGVATIQCLQPSISFSPTSGPYGTVVTLSGSGWAALTSVPPSGIDFLPLACPPVTTTASGTFTVTCTVASTNPSGSPIAPGSYTIGAFITSTTGSFTITP